MISGSKKLLQRFGKWAGDQSFMVQYFYPDDIIYKRVPVHEAHYDHVQKFQ